MSSGDGTVGVVLSLFAVNILYLIVTLVIAWVLCASTADLVTGAFSGVATTAVVVWVAIGTILGIADVYVVFNFISSVTGSSEF